jgi:hypothetical protein
MFRLSDVSSVSARVRKHSVSNIKTNNGVILSQIYVAFDVRWLLFSLDFNQNRIPTNFSNNRRYEISWKSVRWKSHCSMGMDGHDYASSRFSQRERAHRNAGKGIIPERASSNQILFFNFQFFNHRMHFYFRFSVQLILHMFRPLPGHHQGYIDKVTSLFTGPFGIITEPLHCLRQFFHWQSPVWKVSSSFFLKCLGVYSIYRALEVSSIALYIVNIIHYVVGSYWNL